MKTITLYFEDKDADKLEALANQITKQAGQGANEYKERRAHAGIIIDQLAYVVKTTSADHELLEAAKDALLLIESIYGEKPLACPNIYQLQTAIANAQKH